LSGSFIFLQNLILTTPTGIPEALYFKGMRCGSTAEGLEISAGGFADFNSYFNSFAFSRWHEYTGLETVCLKLGCTGRGTVDVTCRGGGPEVIYHFPIAPEGETIIELQPEPLVSRLTVRVSAEAGVLVSSGIWGAFGVPHRQDVLTAAVLCTQGRDDELFRTLELLHRCKPEEMGVIVVDNASRLGKDAVGAYGAGFQLYHNPDTGESGGFTRGLIEAARSYHGYTHALFLAEGIRFDPEMLFRTQALLSCLKPELRSHFLSGAELCSDEPSRLSGDVFGWNGYRRITRHRGLDLADRNNLAFLEVEDDVKNRYAPWVFCALPLGDDILSDLPFPFYSYGDDMDYSYRRAGGVLSLPGLGVWLEKSVIKKSPLFDSYYRCRNTLILNSLYPRRFGFFVSWRNAFRCFWRPFLRRDFPAARFALTGLDDFLEGAEYVTALDEAVMRERYGRPGQDSFNGNDVPGSWREGLSLGGRGAALLVRFFFSCHRAARSFRAVRRDERFWTRRFHAFRKKAPQIS